MKLFTSCHNNLPVNKKTKELSEICCKLVGTLLEDREYSELVNRMEKMVDVANALYPNTTKLWVRTAAESVALALDSSDKSMYLSIHSVRQRYSDIDDILPR
jgi:predicted transcriptional regulator YheO